MEPPHGTIWRGDGLDALRALDTATVDLVYMDPPFRTTRTWRGRGDAADTGYTDRWLHDREHDRAATAGTPAAEALELIRRTDPAGARWGTMLAARLIEVRRVLRPSGSVWIHLDDRAEGAGRLLADMVLGSGKRRNSVRWKRHTAHGSAAQRCGRIVDTLLWYAMSRDAKWRGGQHEYTTPQRARYRHRDKEGRLYKCENLTNPRPGPPERDFDWRGTRPTNGWRHSREDLEALLAAGRIQLKRDGSPRTDGRIVYLDETRGPALQDLWTDIPALAGGDGEATGFPTQKPVALLDRIIRACTDPGDLVVDPFAGSGTTAVAAEAAGRRWLLIENEEANADLAEKRLVRTLGLFGRSMRIDGPGRGECARAGDATSEPEAGEAAALTGEGACLQE